MLCHLGKCEMWSFCVKRIDGCLLFEFRVDLIQSDQTISRIWSRIRIWLRIIKPITESCLTEDMAYTVTTAERQILNSKLIYSLFNWFLCKI